ncbi:MAG: sugar-binding domain-containing protein [Candidatus Latescibacterota bacterium]
MKRILSKKDVPPITKTNETLLSGADWKLGSFAMDQGEPLEVFLPRFDDGDFRTVRVPGEVQLQIGLEGMDRYYQSKQLTLINEKEWWYRKRFVVPEGEAGKLLRLVFDGVDYFATVWLNGEMLGEHEGCYVPFSYEVSSKLKYGAENLLAVKVTCPWIPKGRGLLEYMKGEFVYATSEALRFPAAPFRLGPHWDGIPATGNAVLPMGLFREVKLVASGSTVIDDLFVTTKSLNRDGSATLGVSGTIKNYADQDVAATLDLTMSPENFSGKAIPLPKQRLTIHPGENAFYAEVVVKKPMLWWTWDMGAQNLYVLTATISSAGGGGEDSRTTAFGIRTIVRKKDMSYWVNGKRLFLKGAYYPISDYFGSRPTRETYEQDLEMYRAANLNHLVAFTVVEKPDFYDLCDRLGILVMFEFPFSQEGPGEVLAYTNPRREIFIKESLSQLRQIIIALRNHPSTIVWVAFAEARSRVKGEKWGPARDKEYGYEAYSNEIGKLVAELAPGTVYHPSICDMGERHFWNACAGMGTTRGYQDHFNVNANFISEYGSVAFPVLESLKKMLTPEEMWSTENTSLPRWFDLPLDIPMNAYQTSFDYDGLASALQRVNQFIDRHVQSIQELVDDSQLYQAFLFEYATECYRRKKYNAINGTRIWAYGEVTPGIRFNFLDYYRVPKMGYYFLKRAQERFAVNFAYEETLESQVSGKHLRIPVWVINDHQRKVPIEVQCEILDLKGRRVGSYDFQGTVGSDESKEVGVVDWVAPEKPGVYVLRARTSEGGPGELTAESATFIKVTPRLFSGPFTMLLIGENQYSFPISKMVRAMGINVDVVDENTIGRLAQLRNPEEIRQKYDAVWLACFDSLWKLMDDEMADGLKQAVDQGIGFIHTGGPGSFHGGAGRAACLDFRSLAEVLPVDVRSRDDVIYGHLHRPRGGKPLEFSPMRDIAVAAPGGEGWSDFGLKDRGIAGFNDVDLKPGCLQILTISGRPLLVTGQFGQGRTVAFTGFTPAYTEKMWPKPGPESFSSWKDLPFTAPLPYLVDQEFVADPLNRSYFALFMRMIVAASGEEPATAFDELLAARDQPLFETLKDLPATTLDLPMVMSVTASGRKALTNLEITNGGTYARLVRVRAEWEGGEENSPYLVKYSDNFFDLLPGESKSLALEMFLAGEHMGRISGTLVVEGPNTEPRRIPVEVQPQ